jgi:hydroxyacylglutathione hydrolase
MPGMIKPNVRWFDDWYAKYKWLNWNYLIVGRDRALLFDTGLRDITPVFCKLDG